MSPLLRRSSLMGISPYRLYLADSLFTKYGSSEDQRLFWLLLHLAEQAGNGHIRTDLHRIAHEMPSWYLDEDEPELPRRIQASADSIIDAAIESGLIGRLDREDSPADSLTSPRPPLVLSTDGRFLYFLRRRREEDRLLAGLRKRSAAGGTPSTAGKSPDEAIANAVEAGRKLMILSGGPGTGKTSTIARLLDLLEQRRAEAGDAPLRVLLAAPTGRAASRMAEDIPGRDGRTLHGLLGIRPGKPQRDSLQPLDADLVVVDEASMVDVPMMNALLDALSPDTALLLVGDPDQLPSVEAGALLGDMLAGAREAAAKETASGPLSGSVIHLSKVYRSDTAVLSAASAVRDGNPDGFKAALNDDSVRLRSMKSPEEIAWIIAERYRENSEDIDGFSALTPLRKGPWGVPAMNDRISRISGSSTGPYSGMPVVVTRNDSKRALWNGERGRLRLHEGRLRAVFAGADGERVLPLALLPGWEPGWIQTVHRSQGSEFDSIAVILPEAADRLLTREILYTALTRARHRVEIFAEMRVLESALSKQVVRNSRIRRWASGI